jgi:small basic protein (TIGR04137 family)
MKLAATLPASLGETTEIVVCFAGQKCLAPQASAVSVRASFPKPMSQHRSLKGASTIAAKRNVLKRFERVEVLKKRGQWKEGDRVLGLRKTKPDA